MVHPWLVHHDTMKSGEKTAGDPPGVVAGMVMTAWDGSPDLQTTSCGVATSGTGYTWNITGMVQHHWIPREPKS